MTEAVAPAPGGAPRRVLRRATGPERRRAALSSLVGVVLTVVAVWVWLDVPARPVGSAIAIASMAAGAVWPVLAAVFSWRTDLAAGPKLAELKPSAARWALRRELWGGHAGPLELRPYTRGWVARAFRAPANGGATLFIVGWSLALGGLDVLPPRTWWAAVLLVLYAVLILLAVAELARRRQASRIVEAVESEAE